MDTAMWRFTTADGIGHVLRVYRPEQAAAARREQAALHAVAGKIRAPRVESTGAWRDRPVAVISWVSGSHLMVAARQQPWTLWRLGVGLGRMQARLHSLPVPQELREGAPGYWLDEALAYEPAIVERLRALPAQASTLVHLDYHPLNVLSHAGRITGVVDWMNCAAGDRRADIARTATTLLVSPAPPIPIRPLEPVVGAVRSTVRRLLYEAWRHGYGTTDLPDEALFMAWAAAFYLHDMEAAAGRPGIWFTNRDLDPLRRWTDTWKRRAGVA